MPKSYFLLLLLVAIGFVTYQLATKTEPSDHSLSTDSFRKLSSVQTTEPDGEQEALAAESPLDVAVDSTLKVIDPETTPVHKITVVPSRYTVTEAAQYYIPPEQRSSGNLGGPPALDFPGGPSDPNLFPEARISDVN